MQFVQMGFVEGQIIRPGGAQRGQLATVFCWMSKSSSVLALTWGRNGRFNLTEGPTYVYTVWKILSFECNFCNICWVLVVAMRVNGKAGHMSDIMLICNNFRKVRRTVGPTNAHWADFIGYENGTSTSVQWKVFTKYGA